MRAPSSRSQLDRGPRPAKVREAATSANAPIDVGPVAGDRQNQQQDPDQQQPGGFGSVGMMLVPVLVVRREIGSGCSHGDIVSRLG